MPLRGWTMRGLSRCMVVALMLGLWLSAVAMGEAQKADTVAGAQQQPKEEAGQKTPAVTAQQAGVGNVNVLVTDEDGRTIPGLKKENFRVLDNGTPVTVQNLSPTSAPITVVILLEYSSLAYGYYAGKATYWAAGFLDHLEPRDWVGLVTYDLHSRVRIDFTHNRAAVLDAIGSLGIPTYSESNLFDGLIDTVEMMDRVHGRKTILLLTTGANSFSAASFDDVRRRLRSSDVTIFCVGLAEEEVVRSARTPIGYLQSQTFLREFSEQTGGIAWFPRFQAELPEIFRSVVGFLRSEYTLSFTPPEAARDGKYHKLTVQVVGSDGKPLRITNESGRQRKVKAIARAGYQLPPEMRSAR